MAEYGRTLRLLLEFLASGLVILLANIIHNPREQLARYDTDLADHTIKLLDLLAKKDTAKRTDRIRALCANLESSAKIALDETNAKDPVNAQTLANPRERDFDDTEIQENGYDGVTSARFESNEIFDRSHLEFPRESLLQQG